MQAVVTANTNPFLGVCGYCLGTFHLKGESDYPIRHGFNAINTQHGTSGGWHTGPCRGGSFVFFGRSTAGIASTCATTSSVRISPKTPTK